MAEEAEKERKKRLLVAMQQAIIRPEGRQLWLHFRHLLAVPQKTGNTTSRMAGAICQCLARTPEFCQALVKSPWRRKRFHAKRRKRKRRLETTLAKSIGFIDKLPAVSIPVRNPGMIHRSFHQGLSATPPEKTCSLSCPAVPNTRRATASISTTHFLITATRGTYPGLFRPYLEPFVERLVARVMPQGAQGRHEQRRPDSLPSPAGFRWPLRSPLSFGYGAHPHNAAVFLRPKVPSSGTSTTMSSPLVSATPLLVLSVSAR